ncbi:TraC family protein [Candidatus Saccharibacteria bacterium]|nr:TraC family protein [Candidatus Saccharibacteria bacterium]
MSILKKSNKPASSREQIRIDGVRDGILILPNKEYRLILQTSSINFELMSEDEQDALIDTYQNFLNSLNTSFQIVIRIRELDMDKYLQGFINKINTHDEQIYKKQAENYIDFVGKLVTNNKILTRRFYVVLPYKATDSDFTIVSEQLKQSAELVAKGLGRLGMQTQKLNSLEVLDLFYSFYSPAHAKRQPLREQTIQLLKEAYL